MDTIFLTYNMSNNLPHDSFKKEFEKLFLNRSPDIIFIGLQEATYKLSKQKNRLIRRHKFFKQWNKDYRYCESYIVHVTEKDLSLDEIKSEKFFPKERSSLRLIVLHKRNMSLQIQKNFYYPLIDGTSIGEDYKKSYIRKGAVSIKVTIESYSFTVINVHLPIVVDMPDYGNDLRKLMFNDIMEHFKPSGDYVVMGDFNFRKIDGDDQFKKFRGKSYPREINDTVIDTCKIKSIDKGVITYEKKRPVSRCDRILLSETLWEKVRRVKHTYAGYFSMAMNTDHALVYLAFTYFQHKRLKQLLVNNETWNDR